MYYSKNIVTLPSISFHRTMSERSPKDERRMSEQSSKDTNTLSGAKLLIFRKKAIRNEYKR